MVLRARYYDPSTGEFTSPDPLEYVDGMSLYRGYFSLRNTDPRGLDFIFTELPKPPDENTGHPLVDSCRKQCRELAELLYSHNPYSLFDMNKCVADCVTPPVPPVVNVSFPTPEEGCSGNCISVSGSTVIAITIDEASFSGPDCTSALSAATKGMIVTQVTTMLGVGLSSDTCSTGCSCQNKQVYDGQTISVTFQGEKIQLDPLNFAEDPIVLGISVPVRPTGPNCFIELKGKATIQVGKGWVGTCKKNADSQCP
jgi:hypothetical protein